jgi:ATP-dependent Clp protease adaptor protein ClpS
MTDTIALPQHADPSSILGGAWHVIVRDDNHNTFDHVAATLARLLPSTTLDHGYKLATKIHNTGAAVVWSGHLELAELYWDQLVGSGLTMAPLERG